MVKQPKRPTPHELIREIRKRARESDGVIWPREGHADKRSRLRSSRHDLVLDDDAALSVLRRGDIKGPITRSQFNDGWEVKVLGPVSDYRADLDAGVVVIVLDKGKLFAKTVEWEYES